MADISKIKTLDGTTYDLKDTTARENISALNQITTYEQKTGSIVSFEASAANMPIKSLVAQIEPIQDLHGYSSPWPAGGGKNLCPPFDATTQNGVTITVDNKGVITLNGECTANFNIFVSVSLNAGKYILSGSYGNADFYTGATSESNRLYINVSGSNYIDNETGGRNFTVSEAGTYILRLVILSKSITGVTFSNSVIKPMIRFSTETDDTFTPYENYCQITGWTELHGARTGENLFTNGSEHTSAGLTKTNLSDTKFHMSGTVGSVAYSRTLMKWSGASGSSFKFGSQ